MHEGFSNQGEGQEEENHFQASPKRGNFPFLPDGCVPYSRGVITALH